MKLNARVFVAQALATSVTIGVSLASRPNFVFVLTDDQDVHMESVDYMPEVQEHLIEKGATFDKHYCTVAICCPSRVNLWTGQMSHNTNVTNVQPPHGGYPKFIQNGYNDHHLALWLQGAGYNTYYGGKLFNGHTTSNYDDPFMSGYTDSAFFLEPWTYQYFNVSYTRNGSEPINPVGNYSTDLLTELSLEFLDHAASEDKPFFLTVAPIAPHGFLHEYPSGSESGPPVPAKRHEDLYEDYIIPRTDNFNPDEPSSVNWIANLEQMNDTVLDYNDEYQRLRMRSLASVDELVGDLVRKLEDEDLMDNTYFIYSTDNGFHIGQHRLHPGKMCGLETDINVPMIIRGPGIEAGSVRSAPSSHTDLAPTLMQLAGEDITDKQFDGSPMDLGLPAEDYAAPDRTEHVAVEFWGIGLGESKFASDDGPQEYQNNTYKGLRIEASHYGFYYSVWCNNAREMYDMKHDPGQLDNLLSPSRSEDRRQFTLNDKGVEEVANRLDALTMVLKECKEDTCRDPWGALHPDGEVASLWDALHDDYDRFYEDQVKVEFAWCSRGHILEAEGPQEYNVFGEGGEDDGEMKRFNVDHWSLWVAIMVCLVAHLV